MKPRFALTTVCMMGFQSDTESLQSRIAALEKECALLKKDVKAKEEAINRLQSSIDAKVGLSRMWRL